MKFIPNRCYRLKPYKDRSFIEYILSTLNDKNCLDAIEKMVGDMKYGFKVIKISGYLGSLLKIKLATGEIVEASHYNDKWSALTLNSCAEYFDEISNIGFVDDEFVDDEDQTYCDSQESSMQIDELNLEELMRVFFSFKSIRVNNIQFSRLNDLKLYLMEELRAVCKDAEAKIDKHKKKIYNLQCEINAINKNITALGNIKKFMD